MAQTTTYRLRKTCPPRTRIASVRQSRASMPPRRKDTLDKDSISVEPKEYMKSGSGDQATKQFREVFNPKRTDTSEQREATEKSGVDGTRADQNPPGAPPNEPAGIETVESYGRQGGGFAGDYNAVEIKVGEKQEGGYAVRDVGFIL
ncbi:hypothetical protein FGG08_006873 [Glutinoglossum americanum]|uniref:Uncharacterized protein n=1 Tax=Glutinoglossum americanum TaxID=1670608 RepID=A0A9P8L0J4_9PEZI|nr:hypothetical protein FGG08_006873 [Glutinoglossum americanum]